MKWNESAHLVVALVLAVGCKSEADKACNQLVSSSEVTLLSMNPTDEASVTLTLAELNKTLEACEAAKSPEVSEIKKGVENVKKHLERLKQGEIKQPPPPPSAESLAELQKKGDPECPLGQGYLHPVSKKRINCTGPRMIEQTYAQVGHYFQKHHIATAIKDAMIRGTQAGVTYTFKFKAVDSDQGPLCLTIEAGKEQKVGDLLAFASGLSPKQIKSDGPLKVGDQEVKVTQSQSGEARVVVLGDCDGAEAMLSQPSSEQAAEKPSPGDDSAAAADTK